MRTNLVKTSLEMMNSPPVTTGNGFERTRQGEALSSSRGQHAQQTAGSPSCLCRLRVERQFELGGLPADKVIE